MEKFEKVISSGIPMPIEHVDTDQIIPARFLKATTREGFGDNLFRDWRYDKTDQPIKDFVLNNPTYKGSILVAGENFGCCLLYTSPSPRDQRGSRMPSSA